MKKLIPPTLKVSLKVMQRYALDLSKGQYSNFVNYNPTSDKQKNLFQQQIVISQTLKKTSLSENKKHNLALAIKRIQDVEIQPGKVFSFWHLVGKPDQAKGYLEGRAIVGNQLKADFGGGLCQLSGLLYLLTLKAGLVTLERHPHSHDIYTEETRFAPLGSDATVVYGYKDFRFQNNLLLPICFKFSIQEEEISAALYSLSSIPEYRIEFKREEFESETKVDTIRFDDQKNTFELLNTTIYQKFL